MKVKSIELLREMEEKGYINLLPETGTEIESNGKRSQVWCIESPGLGKPWEFQFKGVEYRVQYSSGGWMKPFVFKYK